MSTHDKYPSRFDVPRLIEDLGGTRVVHRIFLEEGSTVGFKTVQKWAERGYLPPGALAVIVKYQSKGSRPFNIADYIVEE